MGAGGGPSPVWRLPGGGDPPHRSSSSSAPARWGRQAPATSPGARCARCDGRTRSTGRGTSTTENGPDPSSCSCLPVRRSIGGRSRTCGTGRASPARESC